MELLRGLLNRISRLLAFLKPVEEEVELPKPSADTVTMFLVRNRVGSGYTWWHDPLGEVVAKGLFKGNFLVRLQVNESWSEDVGRYCHGVLGMPLDQIEYLPTIRASMLW